MISRIAFPGSWLIALTLLLFASSAVAQEVSPRCEAAMDRAAGDYSRCLLRAEAQHTRDENTRKLERRQARCDTRFERRTTRVTGRNESGEWSRAGPGRHYRRPHRHLRGSVATEASGEPALSLLFVQNASDGTLSESILTLTGVNSETGWSSGRPYQYAGQIPTEEFISFWSEGEGSYAGDPPHANAKFTCTVDGEAMNYVLKLTAPRLDGDHLTYDVRSIGDAAPRLNLRLAPARPIFSLVVATT